MTDTEALAEMAKMVAIQRQAIIGLNGQIDLVCTLLSNLYEANKSGLIIDEAHPDMARIMEILRAEVTTRQE